MYRSSSLTFVYKYLFTPIWGGIFLVGTVSTWNIDDNTFSNHVSLSMALMLGWALFWLIIMMFRLRSIAATFDGLTIKTFSGKKTIDYKNIEWVSQYALLNPILISLKYHDLDTGESKKILVLPSMSDQMFKLNFGRELEITKFIRDRIVERNPNYSKELEPSRWLPAGLIFITGIPFVLFMNMYF